MQVYWKQTSGWKVKARHCLFVIFVIRCKIGYRIRPVARCEVLNREPSGCSHLFFLAVAFLDCCAPSSVFCVQDYILCSVVSCAKATSRFNLYLKWVSCGSSLTLTCVSFHHGLDLESTLGQTRNTIDIVAKLLPHILNQSNWHRDPELDPIRNKRSIKVLILRSL
jgi:hypothetical protein